MNVFFMSFLLFFFPFPFRYFFIRNGTVLIIPQILKNSIFAFVFIQQIFFPFFNHILQFRNFFAI